MDHKNFFIKTDRLTLRPLSIDDIETANIYSSDKENTVYMLHLPNSTREETEQFLSEAEHEWEREQPQYYEFAVVLDGKHIGAVDVYLNELRTEGELGWIINKLYWGNGYGVEAAAAVRDFALNSLKVHRLFACCDQRNITSSRVMQKIGMQLEDSTRKRVYPGTQETASEFMYSLTVSDNEF